jgi:selenocysteine lyase/cysteine desulfurase
MDWTQVRDEFPVTRRWAFLDHAGVAPISARARQAMVDWAADVAENGIVAESRWSRRVEEVRALAGRLLNADPRDIAFVKNTSEGIGLVAEGFPWQPGDNVVTAAEEFPANLYPWMNLEARGVNVRMVPSRGPRLELDDVRRAVDARTRIVALSFVEYASGFRNDLDGLGKLCRERGIILCVDAIQGLGVLPLDVAATPIDFLSADGHKWLLGPEGAAIFYARREMVDLLHPVGVGWRSVVDCFSFSRADFRLKPGASRWESGALAVGAIAALGASLELLLTIGIARVWERVRQLTDYVCEQAARVDLTVFSSRQPGDKSGIVSIEFPGADPRAAVRRCREEGVVINERGGRLRVSPHCYNVPEEVDRLFAALKGPGLPGGMGSVSAQDRPAPGMGTKSP